MREVLIMQGPTKTTFKMERHDHYLVWTPAIDSFRCDCGEQITREAVLRMKEVIDAK